MNKNMNKNNKYYAVNTVNAVNTDKNTNEYLNKKQFNIDILFEQVIGNKINILLLDQFDKYKWSKFI